MTFAYLTLNCAAASLFRWFICLGEVQLCKWDLRNIPGRKDSCQKYEKASEYTRWRKMWLPSCPWLPKCAKCSTHCTDSKWTVTRYEKSSTVPCINPRESGTVVCHLYPLWMWQCEDRLRELRAGEKFSNLLVSNSHCTSSDRHR